MRTYRILSTLILCTPLLVFALLWLFYFVPGFGNFMTEIFWEFFSDFYIFSIANELLKAMATSGQVSMGQFFSDFVALMLSCALEAIFMGCCVFAVQSIFAFAKKKKINNIKWYTFSFSQSKWLLSLVGVCIAVMLNSLFELGPKSLGTGLRGGFSILLLVFGICTILKKGWNIKGKNKANKTKNELDSFLLNLLVQVLLSSVKAIAVVNLITFVVNGPQHLHNHANPKGLLIWFVGSVLFMIFCNLFDKQVSSS